MHHRSTTITVFVLFRSNENVLLLVLVLSMDFLDKLRLTLKSPLKNFQGTQSNENFAIKTWTLPGGKLEATQIRLLLYRDCDRRGRKCLYDSQHVIRDKNGKFSYINTGTNGSELKNLSEYIFGCVPLSSNCGSKRFHKYNGKFLWSQVFSPKTCRSGSVSSGSISSLPRCSISMPSNPDSGTAPTSLSQSPVAGLTPPTDEVDGCPARRIGVINSMPNIVPVFTSSFGKCFSLPSKLADSNQKTLLGLGIMIETAATEGNSDGGIGPYLQAMSATIEECATWFSSVATQAYCNPSAFVQILYDFTSQFKSILLTRLTNPMISPTSLVPNWRALPALTAELTQLLLQNDERHCRLTNRIKLVIVAGSKRINEVAALLYLFKILLLQCTRSTEMDVGIDATAFCKDSDTCIEMKEALSKNLQSNSSLISDIKLEPKTTYCTLAGSFASMSSLSVGISMSSTGMSLFSMSTPSSPPSPPCTSQLSNNIQQIVFTSNCRKEDEKLQKRDYDSGIELELDHHSQSTIILGATIPGKSMRRSISQKFESGTGSGCGSSSDEQHGGGAELSTLKSPCRRYSRGNFLYPQQQSHEFEEVSFHLGDLTVDCEQSFNTLALSEPNLDKLKTQLGSPSYLEMVDSNTKIECLPMEPREVKINFETESHPTKTAKPYCPYCDSIGIVSKFCPLYYIQWIKTTCCNSGLGEEQLNLMKSFSTSKFIVVNLDKSLIRTVNFDANESCRTTTLTSCNSNNSSSLVNNLLHNLQQLLNTQRPECEIDHFLKIQLDFIKKIAHEFGESWIKANTKDSSCLKKKYSYLSLSDNDLKLIYSLAKMKFPTLSSQTED